MTINEYQQEALRTANCKNQDYPLIINGALGLAGEAGEVVDIVKKAFFHGHPLKTHEIVKELGDVAWYLAVTAHCVGYDLESVLQTNVDKLRNRYPEGFDSWRSLHRKAGDI